VTSPWRSMRNQCNTIRTLVVWFMSWQLSVDRNQLITSNMLWAAETETTAAHAASSTNAWQEAPYRIEWWYYTGNVETAEGRRFGYQLTFFRTGVTPTPTSTSQWAVRDLYMAHFAISDLDNNRFYSFERLNRAGVHWAGAETTHYRVWNEGWEARLEGDVHVLAASDRNCTLALRLMAKTASVRKALSQATPHIITRTHVCARAVR
jgi:predicted secreted hydrolase